MAVLPYKLNEAGRGRCGIGLAATNSILTVFGILMIIFGVYMKLEIEEKLMLIDSYDSGALPHMLISVGVLSLLIHGLGAKIWLDLGFYKTRHRFLGIMMIWMFVVFIELWVVIAAGREIGKITYIL